MSKGYERQGLGAPANLSGLPGLAKVAPLRPSWLRDVQLLLDLTNLQMAELLGVDPRTYERWKANVRLLDANSFRLLDALLEERGVDSRGRIVAAKAVGT